MQTAVHLVASRQSGTATSILRLLLNMAGKDIRLKPDSVRIFLCGENEIFGLMACYVE